MENKNNQLNYLTILVKVNVVFLALICISEILSIWINIPFLFTSEGDAFGFSEFSGNWFDHVLKALMGLILGLVFIKSITSYNQNRSQSLSFAIGGSFITFGLGILYLLIWFAQFLDFGLTQSLGEWVWYSGFRLEILLLIFNFPVLKIWKNRFEIFQNLNSPIPMEA